MTSRFLWLFLFILLDTSIDLSGSMSMRKLFLAPALDDLQRDQTMRSKRNIDKSFDYVSHKRKAVMNSSIETDLSSMTSSSNASVLNGNDSVLVIPEREDSSKESDDHKCPQCIIWKADIAIEEEEAYHPNLTIIPMGGVFMFIVYMVIKFIHWCNEDIRLADERYLKISVPVYVSSNDSPHASPAKHHEFMRRAHRRSSVSMTHAKLMQKAIHVAQEGETSNTDDSEDITVIYNDKVRKPIPTAASKSIGKNMSHKMGLHRSPNRYLRRQSVSSSSTTLNSSFSSRSPSVRTRDISFYKPNKCSSPSSLSQENADSFLEVTPLIRHSKSSETPFAQRKLAIHTHIIPPPLLHLQVSSVNTSTTSLGESVPSLASKPSMCDSVMTEHMCISEDNESSENSPCLSPSGLYQFHQTSLQQQKSGMMFLTGSYYEDPLIIECSYMEVDETLGADSEPTVFTLGSGPPSPSTDSVDVNAEQNPIQNCDLESHSNARTEDHMDKDSTADADDSADMDILNGLDSSDCNSESPLTTNHEDVDDFHKDSENTSHCSSPGIYRGMDPSLYYKLSVESNASTGSLQSPESMHSDSTSVCSSEALVRRVNPSVALRVLNTRSHPPRRERISFNGVTYFSQHGGRRIQNGRVMRMCRSWCLGDKASAIYGQLRRGQIEKQCYM